MQGGTRAQARRRAGIRLGVATGLLGVLVAAPPERASAAVCLGVEFPDRIRAAGTTLTLNGLGIRKATFLRIHVYVAALYLPNGPVTSGDTGASAASSASGAASGAASDGVRMTDARAIVQSRAPVELVLRFVRGVGARDIRHAFEEGFATEGDERPRSMLAARIATLNGWMEDMRAGETMTFLRLPGRGVEVSLDGRTKGVIPGDDFADVLFGIWLGDHPPNPELKAGLLGGPCR